MFPCYPPSLFSFFSFSFFSLFSFLSFCSFFFFSSSSARGARDICSAPRSRLSRVAGSCPGAELPVGDACVGDWGEFHRVQAMKYWIGSRRERWGVVVGAVVGHPSTPIPLVPVLVCPDLFTASLEMVDDGFFVSLKWGRYHERVDPILACWLGHATSGFSVSVSSLEMWDVWLGAVGCHGRGARVGVVTRSRRGGIGVIVWALGFRRR